MSGGKLIAICGGIGSGKSVVCRIVAAMGHEVYDCDSRAKEIMDCSAEIKNAIACRVHREAIAPDGSIDRRRLGEIVFSDAEALARLNSIVHAAVREDLALWAARRPGKLLFVETAILYQSGLDAMVDEVWDVEAPPELRLERVMARNGLDAEAVKARIEAQDSYRPAQPHPQTTVIVNDGCVPLLPQLEKLLAVSDLPQ